MVPSQTHIIDLNASFLYMRVLKFAQDRIHRNIVSFGDRALNKPVYARLRSKVTAYNFVTVNGLRYGAFSRPQGQKSCYGYIRGREAVRIEHVFRVAIQPTTERPKEIAIVCAAIRRFRPALKIKQPPWNDLYVAHPSQLEAEQYFTWLFSATDLGIALWEDSDDAEIEIVPAADFSGHFAWAPMTYQGRQLRVTSSLDHVSP